jgi:hypothetical protein
VPLRGARALTFIAMLVLFLAAAPGAQAQTTGGASYGTATPPPPPPLPPVAGPTATLTPTGLAQAPAEAPPQVHAAIAAANRIVGRPYRYGGGHRRVEDTGYDCSGTVSYALIGAGLLRAPFDSRRFMRWGQRGPGRWITVYTKSSHAFAVIAGLRLDTSAAGDPSRLKGPRWRPALRSTRGFVARHPVGL